jgi:hypothetical protein
VLYVGKCPFPPAVTWGSLAVTCGHVSDGVRISLKEQYNSDTSRITYVG